MNYDETIKFLFNNIPNYQKSGKSAIRTGLTNIKILANYFNNPQNSFKSIHVGGTNGKGTTSTSIANLCLSLDLKVGLFTSPHIYDFRERKNPPCFFFVPLSLRSSSRKSRCLFLSRF